MYAGRIACCPWVSHGKYADGTDRATDGHQQLHNAFCYGRGQRNYGEKYENNAYVVKS